MMSEQYIDDINSGDESDHDLISTEMLENIRDKITYKIRDFIRQRQLEWKGALKATRITGKGLHKLFSTVVKEIFASIDTFGRIWFRSFPFHSRTNLFF